MRMRRLALYATIQWLPCLSSALVLCATHSVAQQPGLPAWPAQPSSSHVSSRVCACTSDVCYLALRVLMLLPSYSISFWTVHMSYSDSLFVFIYSIYIEERAKIWAFVADALSNKIIMMSEWWMEESSLRRILCFASGVAGVFPTLIA